MREMAWIIEALKERGLSTAMRVALRYMLGRLRGVDDIIKCALCPNFCKFNCPTHIASGSETHSPAGRARVAFFIESGVLELNPENALPLYTCLGCLACKAYCPFNFSVPEITYRLRVRLRQANALPIQLAQIVDNLSRHKFLHGPRPAEDRIAGNLLYIRGCTVRQHLPSLAEITMEVFKRFGVTLATHADEVCCGFHAYLLGAEDIFRDLAKMSIELLKKYSCAITSCPTIAYTYRVLYPRFGFQLPIEVYHVTELLKRVMSEQQVKLREVRKKVVVHESWPLSRGIETSNVMLDLLKSIPGVEVALPIRHGRYVYDIGGYCSLLKFVNQWLVRRIAQERLRELSTVSNIIVTSSPDATIVFRELGANVYDIVEVMAEALGL